MVHVRVTRSADGCLSALVMTGHVSVAAGPRGANLICAAVTGLVRSCAETIVAASGIVAGGDAGREGELHVTVRSVESGRREWLHGVTGRPMGVKWQAWSAGMFLAAKAAVDSAENILAI